MTSERRRFIATAGALEPGTVGEFVFNKKAYASPPSKSRSILDLAAAAVQVHGFMDYQTMNVIATERLRTEFKGKVELVQFSASPLRDLKKLAIDVIREQSEKTPMAKVHASFTKFQGARG